LSKRERSNDACHAELVEARTIEPRDKPNATGGIRAVALSLPKGDREKG
jgi:hypothetical protein